MKTTNPHDKFFKEIFSRKEEVISRTIPNIKHMKKFTILLFLTIATFSAFSQEFKDWEIKRIHEDTKGVIDLYNTYSDIIGDISETREDREKFFIPQLVELFVSKKAMVYNDLDPDKKAGEKLPIERYAANIILWYPNGLATEVSLKNIEFGDIQQMDEENYFINVNAIKYISGFYLGQKLNRVTSLLEYRIGFQKKDRVYTNYKIAGINFIKTVRPMPEPAGEINGKPIVTQGDRKVLYAIPPIPEADTVFWSLPTGFEGESFTNEILVDITKEARSGIIKVRGKNPSGFGEESVFQVIVNELPDGAGEITGEPIVMAGQQGLVYKVPEIKNADEYVWNLPFGVSGRSKTNRIKINIGESATAGQIRVYGKNRFGRGETSFFQLKIIEKPRPLSVCLYATPSQTSLKIPSFTSTEHQEYSKPAVNPENVVNYGLKIGYMFNAKHDLKIGIGTGIELSAFKSGLSMESYIDSIHGLTDKNNDTYEKRTTGNGIQENVELSYMSIPVCLKIVYSFSKNFHTFVDGGINFSILSSASFSANGTTSYRGFYPDYNVVLYGIEDYGFIDDNTIEISNGKLEVASQNMIAFVQAGIEYSISNQFGVFAGINYENGISDISTPPVEQYHLSDNESEYIPVFYSASEIKTNTIGGVIGLTLRF